MLLSDPFGPSVASVVSPLSILLAPNLKDSNEIMGSDIG